MVGSLITLHGQESRAELVILYPQEQGRTHEDRLRVTVASKMGRVACPAIEAQVA
jgi:hypothetical protein